MSNSRDAGSLARCTCRGLADVCPRCTPVNYTQTGAKHRKRVARPSRSLTQAPYLTTEARPVTR